MIRSVIERLSRGRVIRRRLPRSFGSRSLYLSPDSALAYLKPNWAAACADLFDVANRHVQLGDHVWDIGANVGVFTVAAAERAGPDAEIVAIEADPFLASLLVKTALRNPDRQIFPICAAASASAGIERFVVAKRGRSSNSLESVGDRGQAGGTRYVQYVTTLTLDGMLERFRPPSLIKIDVEGAEIVVLSGAERILSQVRPTFYIEVGGDQVDEVTQIFHRHNYELYAGGHADAAPIQKCVFNTIAVPR